MQQPQGFEHHDHHGKVCLLNKALYGLKQAPRAWYDMLSKHLIDLGFTNSLADSSLFVLQQDQSLVYTLFYVDDILITGNNKNLIQKDINQLQKKVCSKRTRKSWLFSRNRNY